MKKNQGRTTTTMTILGKIIWKGMCSYAGAHGITHPLEHFADDVLPLGSKTLKRRLSDDEWQHKDLLILQNTLKSKEVKEYIDKQYEEALKQ